MSSQTSGISYVRFLHAVSNAPDVDLYFNYSTLLEEIGYKQISDYKKIATRDDNEVSIKPAGGSSTVTFIRSLNLQKDTYYTIIAYGNLLAETPDIKLAVFKDHLINKEDEYGVLRLINLVEGPAAIDLIDNNTEVFENVRYGHTDKEHPYIQIHAEPIHNIVIIENGNRSNVLQGPITKRLTNGTHTIFAVGIVGDKDYPLELIISEDIEGVYLAPPNTQDTMPTLMGIPQPIQSNLSGKSKIRFVHTLKTPINVAINGSQVISSMYSGVPSEYVKTPSNPSITISSDNSTKTYTPDLNSSKHHTFVIGENGQNYIHRFDASNPNNRMQLINLSGEQKNVSVNGKTVSIGNEPKYINVDFATSPHKVSVKSQNYSNTSSLKLQKNTPVTLFLMKDHEFASN